MQTRKTATRRKNKFQMVFFARLMSTESTKHKFSLFFLSFIFFSPPYFSYFAARGKNQEGNRRQEEFFSVYIPSTRCDLPFFRWVFCHFVRFLHCCRGECLANLPVREQNLENKCVRYNQLQLSDTTKLETQMAPPYVGFGQSTMNGEKSFCNEPR